MVFPVVMYGCESWTIKKTERQGIDAFELWCSLQLIKINEKKKKEMNCGVGEDSWESLGLQGDPTSPC